MTVQLIRKRKLREEYALLWLIATFSILILSIFGGIVGSLARFLNIAYSPTLPLVAGILFALVVLLSLSVALSNQANQNRDLAQEIALMEYRLRQLENQHANDEFNATQNT
ncbi:MAG: DUF2304 domain-containing protein [Candidatus Promineifilaceae bacterium]|nr:DUF2304 domain-containing protein [Candidatus Promineifilaceae bacterium]